MLNNVHGREHPWEMPASYIRAILNWSPPKINFPAIAGTQCFFEHWNIKKSIKDT
jgi:hypothetical protein